MSQNLWVLIGKGIAKKIHCCFAVFILLTFVGAAHAAGYTCSSSKKFTSCNTGYYISNCPTSSSSWTGQTISSSALTTGNSCKSCPSGYSCSGGLVCPKRNTVTITLNKNGGSGNIGTGTAIVGGRSSATITCTAGAACALPQWSSNVSATAKNTNITNGSKVFVGWATTSTATSGSFTIRSTTDRTLYAVWKTPTCSATNGSCTIQNASENRPTARISCSTGYSLNGGLAGGDISLIVGFIAYGEAGETEVSGSCLANCNTITFNSTQNGGSGGWSTKLYKKTGNSTWYSNSSCSTVRTAAITKPTKTNATFAGFYNTSDATGGTQFISSTGALLTTSGLTVTAPTTLYAQYDCNTGYTGNGVRIAGACARTPLKITLNKNGGSGILKTDYSQTSGTESASLLCYYGEPCTLPSWDDTDAAHRNNITNGKKIFTGWSTTQAVRDGDTGDFTMTFTADDVVYAVWIQPTCTVTGGHGTCIIANSVLNRPTAIFGCDTGYVDSNDSGNTSWEAYGTSGATSVVDECVARQYTCAAGTYLNGTTCSTCQTLYYCPGGTFTYNGASQGDNRCPVTAIDQAAVPWHYASDPGAKAQTDCYVYGDATEFSDYCAAGQWRLYYDSSEGDYRTFTEHSTVTAKPGAYVDDSFHVGPTCSPCQNATYSEGGDVHTCSTCPTIYTDNTTAGKSSANQCQVRTDAGYYIAAPRDDEQTGCPIDSFCTSVMVNYGSTNAPEKCPDAATHIMTTYPSNYYDVQTITNKNQTWGNENKKSASECLATYYGSNERGSFNVESVGYNPDTGKYDRGGSFYYGSISSGYYADDRFSDTYCNNPTDTKRMLYRDAQPCPAGSYCPGLTSMPLCTSGEYTATNGINACPANYGTSPAQSTANTQCYLTTTAGKWVANKNAAQTSCTAGGFCVGGVKVNYGSTGGRTLCVTGAYSGAGATACIACEDGTTTSGAGQSSCNAKCANAADSKGDEAVKTWAETTWNTNNTVSDLCVAVRCFGGDEGHYLDNGNCPRCDSLANGLYPRSPQGGTSDGPEACFLYESDIPGQYIATQEATSATDCPLATYQAGSERAIHYGEFSECDTCPDNTYADEEGLAQCKNCLENYTTYGEKISPSACRISCPAGAYLAAANDTECTDVGVGYWAAQSFVTQGNAGIRNKCASGLTTIGFGAGADEASDCGRVLNIGGEKIYLRSAKKTDLALNVNIGGTTYYGNMSTEDKFMSDGIEKSLKLNVDGTIYSVYDDSGEYYSGGGSSAVSISPNLEATSTVPANYNDDNGLNWSANMSNGVVISGVAGCDSTTAENGDIAASGFTPSGSGNGCYCRITSPGDGGTRWVYATTHNQCSTKCAYMCANNMKGDSSKNITYRTNLYQVAGILGS